MCGGVLGDAIGGIDKTANSINPLKHVMQWATDNSIAKVPGIGKPAAQLYDYSNSHPSESLAAMATIYAGGTGAGAWGGGGEAGAAGAADSGSINLFADAVPGAGGDVGASAGAAGAADAGSTNLFADAVPGAGGDVGASVGGAGNGGTALTAGIGGPGNAGGGSGNFLSSLFKSMSGGGSGGTAGLTKAGNGLGMMQILSSLYGMQQSRKLSKEASAQSVSKAGLQSVMRSMASQGYQGSGNMMAALSKYGADAYGSNMQQKQASLGNTMSGLGLLTAGLGNMNLGGGGG